MKKIAIIGAGLGGLSAAVYLSTLGYKIDIYEKNEKPGGKINEYRNMGFRFDTGPSVLTMPFIFEELFEFAGYKLSDFLELQTVEPTARNFFSKDEYVDVFSDVEKFQKELTKLSESDAQNLNKYIEHTKKIYDNSADIFLYEPLHEVKELYKRNKIPSLLNFRHIDAFNTVHSANKKFFKNEKIIKIFDRYATYNGSNPYVAPGTLNIIPYVEIGLGCYYIKGGIYKLIEAVCKVLDYKGVVEIKHVNVQKILQKNNKIIGIKVNNQVIEYDYVVCNSDVIESYSSLIDGYGRKRKSLSKLEPSLSGMVFMWGVKGNYDRLKHHNVLFSKNYENEFHQIFEEKTAPNDPTIYIAITSKSDENHAPDNSENWFVLLNMPYLTENQNWEELTKKTRKNVLKKLNQFGFDIEDKIVTEKTIKPDDMYKLYGSNKGSIYGISSNSKMTAFKRPANRSREIEGLYFVGGATHPGGGMPLVTLSGRNTAKIINNFEGF